jgi:UDP-glucose 4-epimerase
MIELINDELGTNVKPQYIENPLEEYVHDTMADYTKLYEDTGWEPQVAFEEGVSRVCKSYR